MYILVCIFSLQGRTLIYYYYTPYFVFKSYFCLMYFSHLSHLSSPWLLCPHGAGLSSVALRPDGMGGRTGLASEPGRPGDVVSVGETRSGVERGTPGVRPDSRWSAVREREQFYSSVRGGGQAFTPNRRDKEQLERQRSPSERHTAPMQCFGKWIYQGFGAQGA